MSQPAARLGDMTAHGGVLTSGAPTVLINGQPAATLGSLHVCPLCSPGPHVGGPVIAGAPTVFIGGQPAARVGDLCACSAPAPDAIIQGSPNVLIGGASAGATPGLAAVLVAAHYASLAPGTPGTGTSARPVSPWVGVGYVDAQGRPVTGWHYRAKASGEERRGQVGSGGQVWADALASSGSVSVVLVGAHSCRWEKPEARVGEAVAMSARCVGLDGELALFEVWRETVAADGTAERVKMWEVMGKIISGVAEAAEPFVFAWDPAADQEPTERRVGANQTTPPELNVAGDSGGARGNHRAQILNAPTYVAEIVVGGPHRSRSGRLRYQDWIEIELLSAEGISTPSGKITLLLASGEVRRLTADQNGVVRAEALSPGPISARVEPDATASR